MSEKTLMLRGPRVLTVEEGRRLGGERREKHDWIKGIGYFAYLYVSVYIFQFMKNEFTLGSYPRFKCQFPLPRTWGTADSWAGTDKAQMCSETDGDTARGHRRKTEEAPLTSCGTIKQTNDKT